MPPIRAVLSRILLIVGLGFAAMVIGSLFAGPMARALHGVAGASVVARLVFFALVGRFWILVVLPFFAWLLARILDLRPWRTALGAAFVGELALIILDTVMGTLGTWLYHPGFLTIRVLSLAFGALLTARAIGLGRRQVEKKATP